MHFGEKILKLLKERGQTYQDLANALGFKSRSNITYYVNREKLPSHEILDKICAHFGVSDDYFKDEKRAEAFHQKSKEYSADSRVIPIMSSDISRPVKIGESAISYLELQEGFIIVVDEQLEKLGFPLGSQLFLSTEVKLSQPDEIVICQSGKERFFAACEKRGENIYLYPLDKGKEPVKLDENGVSIYATLKYVLAKSKLFDFRQ